MLAKPAIDWKRYVFVVLLAVATVGLSGASCNKSTATSPENNQGVVQAIDDAEAPPQAGEPAAKSPEPEAEPTSTEPVAGVELDKLDAAGQKRFHVLVDSLSSPCGKAHSLRKSVAEDKECKRAVFAARYLAALIEDEAPTDLIREMYDAAYREQSAREFVLSNAVPHSGPADAPVRLVEFYDYGCPSCKTFKPLVEEVVSNAGGSAVVFYKQYPLVQAHPDSKGAAQAVLAAAKQGKFKEMHDLLFQQAPRHGKQELLGYAKQLGLDMAKFEADFAAAAKQVEAEMAEGEAAEVSGTPTLFVNGREYRGPPHPRYIKLFVEQEQAVNR